MLPFVKGGTSASCECPSCRQRTTVYWEDGKQITFSEQRLLRIFSYARSKKWTCPEHEDGPVVVAGIHAKEGRPLELEVRFLCKASRGWRKPVPHSGSVTVNLLTLEKEMRAASLNR